MSYVFDVANVAFETLIALFYFKCIFKVKESASNLFKITIVGAAFVILSTTSLFHFDAQINLVSATIVNFAMAYFLFEGGFYKKLFCLTIYMVIIFFADMLTGFILMNVFDSSYANMMDEGIIFMTGAIVTLILRLMISYYVAGILASKLKSLPLSYNIFLILCPILSVITLVIVDLVYTKAGISSPVLAFIPIGTILYVNFMTFHFFDTFANTMKLKVVEKLRLQEKENYKLLENNEEEMRSVKHDLNNHTLMIRSYIEQGDNETALKHLSDIDGDVKRISTIIYTKNISLDTAINIGHKKACAEKIEYSVQVIGDEEVFISPADISTVFSNAIDNAIEACRECSDGYIYIELKLTKEKLFFHIENTTKRSVLDDMTTTKRDKLNHGYGLKNIKKTVKKYNGSVIHKLEDNIFSLDIDMDNIEK